MFDLCKKEKNNNNKKASSKCVIMLLAKRTVARWKGLLGPLNAQASLLSRGFTDGDGRRGLLPLENVSRELCFAAQM